MLILLFLFFKKGWKTKTTKKRAYFTILVFFKRLETKTTKNRAHFTILVFKKVGRQRQQKCLILLQYSCTYIEKVR
jgi:hypothetical protein